MVGKEKRKVPQPGTAATHITTAVLDASDIRVLGKRDHSVYRQVQPCVGWNTVQHHGNWREVSNLRDAERRESSYPGPRSPGHCPPPLIQAWAPWTGYLLD